jgi:UDPglucose--hexose-1-phosphate uridylyltransferase
MALNSEIRKAYFLNKYVIITPGRAKRPRDIKEETLIKRTGDCFFCPGKTDKSLEVKQCGGKKDNWDIMVLKNKFPAVTLDNQKAYGYQEVIIDTSSHAKILADLPVSHIVKLLQVYSNRTECISKMDHLEYILVFKNEGSKAGASVVHDHSQVFATKVLPPDVREELVLASEYKDEKGSCVYCDIVEKEKKSSRRIFEDSNVVAFAPYASEYHYEAWIFTKRHLDNITKLNKKEFLSFAKALKLILSKLDSIGLSYNYFCHQVISNGEQHFYLKIQPRDSIWAGVELGSGLVINSVPPEVAAKFYRK